MTSLTLGSLCSGIGGLELGMARASFRVVFQSEIDEYCLTILKKNFPEVLRFGEIEACHSAKSCPLGRGERIEPKFEHIALAPREKCGGWHLPAVDALCAGWPCQPSSTAGRRKGTQDERWLWPQVSRIVRDLGPRWFVGENVPGLRSVNGGAAMDEVMRDLARCGYDADVSQIPASLFHAPHLRYRVFVVAWKHGLSAKEMEGATTEVWAHPPLVPRSLATGNIWRTPTAADWKDMGSAKQVYLSDQVRPEQIRNPDKPVRIPTPTSTDAKSSRNATANRTDPNDGAHPGTTLTDYVTLWPTPQSRDFRSGKADKDYGNARPLNEAVLWPTPSSQGSAGEISPDLVRRGKKLVNRKTGRVLQTNLATEVKMKERETWPTPSATLGSNAGLVTPRKGREGGTLVEAVSARMWPTPTKADGMGGPGTSGRDGGENLRTRVAKFPTPRGSEGGVGMTGGTGAWEKLRDLQSSGKISSEEFSAMTAGGGGSLSADWVSALMGFPPDWTETDGAPPGRGTGRTRGTPTGSRPGKAAPPGKRRKG